jgi:hypothetical protein
VTRWKKIFLGCMIDNVQNRKILLRNTRYACSKNVSRSFTKQCMQVPERAWQGAQSVSLEKSNSMQIPMRPSFTSFEELILNGQMVIAALANV